LVCCTKKYLATLPPTFQFFPSFPSSFTRCLSLCFCSHFVSALECLRKFVLEIRKLHFRFISVLRQSETMNEWT
jgi:hypothetical protein